MTSAINLNTNGNGSPKADDSGYPIFQPNQVLSNKDLNRVFSYLDNQSRLTRTQAIGIGIICGLTVEAEKLEVQEKGADDFYKIIIAEGCGITSAGYLIHYQQIGKPEDYTFTHFQEIELERQKFGHTEDSEDLVQVRELVTATMVEAEQQQEGDFSPLIGTELKNKAIAVLYDWEDSRRDTCLMDCDDRGIDRHFRLRFLLLDREPVPTPLSTREEDSTSTSAWLDATTLLKEGYQIKTDPQKIPNDDLKAYFQSWYQVPDCTIKRLGYLSESGKETIDLTKIIDLQPFKEAYKGICQRAIASISEAFSKIPEMFGPFSGRWKPDQDDFDGLKKHLEDHLKSFPKDSSTFPYGIQYFYDYLVDLIAAYHELKDLLFDLMADCLPDLRRFPNYLLLGEVLLTEPKTCEPPSLYRHHLTQPPIYNDNAQRFQEAHHLYKRLLLMSQNFELPSNPQVDIKVTPSRSRLVPLGEQAIPYYYNYPALLPYWNYDACRKGRHEILPAYASDHSHLCDRFDWSDFFRIEGHVGTSVKEAEDGIDKYRQEFNLAFDLITIGISQGASLGDYAKQYPGLEHLGGVPKGGTFVLVSTLINNTQKVIGDFCLPSCYKPPVTPAENCFEEFCLKIRRSCRNQETIFAVRERRDGKISVNDEFGGRLYQTPD